MGQLANYSSGKLTRYLAHCLPQHDISVKLAVLWCWKLLIESDRPTSRIPVGSGTLSTVSRDSAEWFIGCRSLGGMDGIRS